MALITNSNLQSQFGNLRLNETRDRLASALEKLSSGKRINKAADDAAGLAIAARFATEILGSEMAVRNSLDGISLAQVADGATGQINESIQRMRELAVQSGNGTLTDQDRQLLQEEFSQLQDQVGEIITDTEFNGQAILSENGSIDLQVGGDVGETVSVNTSDLQAELTTQGFFAADISTSAGAQGALDSLASSIDAISSVRSEFGASVNRIESVVRNLQQTQENQEAARSRIEDADFARQTSELTRNLILERAGIAAQAQSNVSAQQVLGLLRG